MFRLAIMALVLFTSITKAQTELKEREKFSPTLHKLEQLNWKSRVLLIFETNKAEEQALKLFLEENTKLVQERDLYWFLVNGAELISNSNYKLTSDLNLEIIALVRENAPIVLIGKDGEVKYQATNLDLQEVFSRIDSMPMRRAEMRQK